MKRLAYWLDVTAFPTAGDPGSVNVSSLVVLQRFVRPPVSRACVVRAQHRHQLGHAPRPIRAYSLEAPSLISKPWPAGEALDDPQSVATMLSSSGTPHASAKQISVRGDAWNEIKTAVARLTGAIRYALNLHLDELVVEIILTPRGHTQWWMTQARRLRRTVHHT